MDRLSWSKSLTESDAQQEGGSRNMPLRLTKSELDGDHKTWFRQVFFSNANWKADISSRGRQIELAEVEFSVSILGEDKGMRRMLLDHDPLRAEKHSAPTTHLHYDEQTRDDLEGTNLAGCDVVLHRDEGGQFFFIIQAA